MLRTDLPIFWIEPAEQSLGPYDAARSNINQRLIAERKLVALERVPETGLQAGAGAFALSEFVSKDVDAAAAVLLGNVHCRVRMLYERFDVISLVREDGNPYLTVTKVSCPSI